MSQKLKYLLIGSPLPTAKLFEERLNKIRALAAFSPAALSSIAYANQEIYLGLVIAGSAGLAFTTPLGIIISTLLIIVAISYYQTIHGYPTGGGSYSVARENLGTFASLLAAASLLLDYLLTAAVSLTAAVAEIASVFPVLWNYRVWIALGILLIITTANLRGAKETGTFMSIPVYLFLLLYLLMLIIGVLRATTEGPQSYVQSAPPAVVPVSLLLLLRTFAAGCTAISGIEAISNGVPAFQPPEAKNAGKTILILGLLMGLLFAGSISLTQYFGIIPGPHETILSAFTRRIIPFRPLYILIQASTMLILSVAANTSFTGFPRLAAKLADDGFLPRQFKNLGDRLVFSNGILILSVATGALIVLFNGNSHTLIPLFAIGVFLAFTISQFGMVIHWLRIKGNNWFLKLTLNGIGGIVTGITTIIIIVSKFVYGAWITLALIIILIYIFYRIKAHYLEISNQLSLHGLPPSISPFPPPRVVIPISGIHRGIFNAVNFACTISNNITAVYIELEPGSGKQVKKKWEEWYPDIKMTIVPSPYRSIIQPFLSFLDEIDQESHDGQMAVVIIPEFVPARWWQEFLHNQSSWLLKTTLLYRRRFLGYQRVIIDVPYHLKK